MKLRTALFSLFVGLCTLFGGLNAAEQRDYLEERDVHAIMEKILKQHVESRQVDAEILERSLAVYIDQLDPDRVYFLKSETDRFQNLREAQLHDLLNKYRSNDYSTFTELNEQAQYAIHRARTIRQQLLRRLPQLVAAAKQEGALTRGIPANREDKAEFPRTVSDLTERIRNDIIRFIAAQRLRVGDETLHKYQDRLATLYESRRRGHEHEYLFQTDEGVQLSPADREHYFVLHMLKAITASLDAHSAFFDAAEAYDMRVRLEKGFQGIGVVLQESLEGVLIVRLIDGGPAQRSGQIEPNDRLVAVNGHSIVDAPFREVLELIRGEEGSTIQLGLKRLEQGTGGGESERSLKVSLKRERVIVSEDRVDVETRPVEGGTVGIIKLYSFYEGKDGISSEKDVRDALIQLSKRGDLRGLILDLRGNTGGFLVQAVKVAGLFISNGVVVVSKYGDGNERIFRDIDGYTYYNGPLVVLTSRVSASAAEIVAQALQDYGKAIVVGDEQTYGKGSIQHQTITNESSTSFFKVTVGRFYTVSGRSTQIRGVEADIVVPSPFYREPIGERFLDYPLNTDKMRALYDDRLADIDEPIRFWYSRYYLPSLQHRLARWEQHIPELRKRSRERVESNREFQQLLSQKGDAYQATVITASEKNKEESLPDHQLEEAVNIVQDMVQMTVTAKGFPENPVLRAGNESSDKLNR